MPSTIAPAIPGASTRCMIFTHGQSDALEYITHSLCTLEFENHRPLYDWFLDNLPVPSRPRQIEFGRLNLNYTVMSKRKLLQLVDERNGFGLGDDPRMPTFRASAVVDILLRRFANSARQSESPSSRDQ